MSALKGMLIFGLGAVAGFGAGWYVFKTKYKRIADTEIDEVKKYYLDKHLKEQKKVEELINDSKKIDAAIEKYEKVAETEKKEPSKAPQKTKYNKVGEEKKEDEEVKAEAESPEEDEPTKPYLITEDEFLNDKNEYDKISLTYYMLDDTLADEFDEMIDIEEAISSDIFNQIAGSDEDLYVRNNTLETDFEIMKVEGSFHDKYGGF